MLPSEVDFGGKKLEKREYLVQFGTLDLAKLVRKQTTNWQKRIQCDTVLCYFPPQTERFDAKKG